MKKLFCLVFVFALLGCVPKPPCGLEWREPMSVEMTNPAGAQYISFSPVTAVTGLTQRTYALWFRPDVVNIDQSLFGTYYNASSQDNEYVLLSAATGAKVDFWANWETSGGWWRTSSNQLTAATWAHIVVTYDASLTTNDPIIYINGVSVSITEVSTPAGAWWSGSNSDLAISDPDYAVAAADGKFADARVYNTILSAADVLALYNAGAFSPSYDTNLVFHAPLTNATNLGGSAFNGYTLTSSTKLIDRINCAQGTPSGSPLGSSTNP